MKLSVGVDDLRDSINAVKPAIPSNPSLLAYSGVHLEVSDGQLEVIGSDGETTLCVRRSVLDLEPGRVLLPPKPLLSYLNGLASGKTVTLELANGDLAVEAEGMERYTFRPLSATYPAAPTPQGEAQNADLTRLSQGLSLLRAAVPKDTSAVQVVSSAEGLTLNATDTFRLTRVHLPEAGFGDFSGVLPLTVLEKAAKSGASEIIVDTKLRMVAFNSEGMSIVARLLALPFPAVESVTASLPPDTATVRPGELSTALGRLAAVAEQSAVTVVLEGDTMQLTASTAEVGRGSEAIQLLGGVRERFEVLVRAAFLADAVGSVPSDTAEIRYSGPLAPLFIRAADPVDVLHVVMPVRS